MARRKEPSAVWRRYDKELTCYINLEKLAQKAHGFGIIDDKTYEVLKEALEKYDETNMLLFSNLAAEYLEPDEYKPK